MAPAWLPTQWRFWEKQTGDRENERGGRAAGASSPVCGMGRPDGPLIRPPAAATFPGGRGISGKSPAAGDPPSAPTGRPQPPRQHVATAQPSAALPPYGCGVPLAGKAERAEIGAAENPTTTPSNHRSCYAGTRRFKRQGMAQGRRGHRDPPHRFARLPSQGQAAPPVRPGGFLLTGRGRFLLSRQKKMGADPPREARGPARPAGANEQPRPGLPEQTDCPRPAGASAHPPGPSETAPIHLPPFLP